MQYVNRARDWGTGRISDFRHGLGMLLQGLGQDQRINCRSVGARVIAFALPGIGKARCPVERDGCRVVGGNFEKGAIGAARAGGGFELREARSGKALAPSLRMGRNSEKFGLPGDGATQSEALSLGDEKAMGRGKKCGEFLGTPRTALGEGRGMEGGEVVGCHQRMTGAASRAGAASAGLR